MDDLEFKERLFADPFTEDQDIIDAAASNPELAQLQLELQSFERQLGASIHDASVPSDLLEKLLSIPATDASTEARIANIGRAAEQTTDTAGAANTATAMPVANQSLPLFQYFALAASVVVALGLTYSFLGNNGAPSAADIAFSQEVLNHLRLDTDAVNAESANVQVQIQTVNSVLGHAGVQLISASSLGINSVKFAEPCVIIPSNESAHLVIQGRQGVVNVIVINNSPVANEFRITDGGRGGIVIPMSDGNLVLVSENEEDLDQYSELFSDNLQWSI